jgi:uncharacterized protein
VAEVRRLETAEGREVATRVEVAGSFLRRGLGLMFRAGLPPGHGLMITPCNSIHMLFMRFPLDVAFLDREGRVVRIYPGIRPWRMSRVVRGARSALELPAGTLAAAGVEPGTVLRLV